MADTSDLDEDLNWLIDDSDDGEKGSKNETPKKSEVDESDIHQEADGGMSYQHDLSDSEDDEVVGLTPEERELVARNTLLNDDSGEDYNLQLKLKQANETLAEENLTDRKRTVGFKQKLVDVEAPPIDYETESLTSSSSSSSDSEDESNEITTKVETLTIEKEDKTEEKSEPNKRNEVLVEKDGKFHMLDLNNGSSQKQLNAKVNGDKKTELPPLKVNNTKPPLATTSSTNATSTSPRYSYTPTRPSSAPSQDQNRTNHRSNNLRPMSAMSQRKKSEYDYIKSPYAMSSEMKELMQKRAAARAAREREEELQRKQEEEEARQNAEYAWKCWLEKKNSEERGKKKSEVKEDESKKQKYQEEAEQAYREWLKNKRLQRRKDRLYEQQQKIERDECYYIRERKECNRAFRAWLREKRKTSDAEKAQERRLARRAKAEAYRAKKVQKLLNSIQNSQQYKYVEYYGYRF